MKKLKQLKGSKVLSHTEKRSIAGGTITKCNYPGDTGQRCIKHSDCTDPGNPVCFNGCCNIYV